MAQDKSKQDDIDLMDDTQLTDKEREDLQRTLADSDKSEEK